MSHQRLVFPCSAKSLVGEQREIILRALPGIEHDNGYPDSNSTGTCGKMNQRAFC